MTRDESLERAGKIMQLSDEEKWSAAESVFAAGMAYVLMSKAIAETDSVIVSRIARLTQAISVSQANPKN